MERSVTEHSPLESRLIEVEFQLMHLQRDFDHLNAECQRQQHLIQQQQRRMESLEQLLRERIERRDSTPSDREN